jgi:hypothetical protein
MLSLAHWKPAQRDIKHLPQSRSETWPSTVGVRGMTEFRTAFDDRPSAA